MENTHFVDLDLVIHRVPQVTSDLTEIEFADMEPLDDGDVVGVFPLEAVAMVPLEPYDLVGVVGHSAVATTRGAHPPPARPFAAPHGRPEDLETEEFAAFG